MSLDDVILGMYPSPDIGGNMKIKIWTETGKDGEKVFCLDRPYRNAAGVADHYRRRTTDYKQHLMNEIEAAKISDTCSLTSKRFSECVRTYLKEKGTGGFSEACYTTAAKELGNLFPDRMNFLAAYTRYKAKLNTEKASVNTVKNYLIVVRTICNYAYKTGRCASLAVKDWGIVFGDHRERILTSGEELTLLNTLKLYDSPILPHIMFSLNNPIRKHDLFDLKRSDLKAEVYEGRLVYVVRFRASKTRKTVKVTTLVNIDDDFVKYERALPTDCEWLFPIVGTEKNRRYTKLEPGQWKKVIDSDRHFEYILGKAGLLDFLWHDLKHCAETHMLRQGFTYDQMKKLGIQMSPKTQLIYDNRSSIEIAVDVLRKENCRSNVGSTGRGIKKYA